jgi:uncharacterized protein (DUF58 family)
MAPRSGRRRLRFTREGAVFVVVTLGVGIAAVNTGNNLLYLVLGFMLSLIVLSGMMAEITLRSLSVQRRVPERLFAGATSLVEIVLTNDKPRSPSYSVEIEDRAEGAPTDRRCYFLKVAARGQQIGAYRRTPARRGILHLTGLRLSTRYPFGLFETWRFLERPSELVVYPALVPAPAIDLDAPSEGAEVRGARHGHGLEIAGLRDYRDGDDARAIHWRRSATLGELVIRDRERFETPRVSLILDNARPDAAHASWDDAFEHAVSVAAAVAAATLRRGVSVEICTRGSRSPFVLAGSPPDPLWRFLALLPAIDAADAPPLERPRATPYLLPSAALRGA